MQGAAHKEQLPNLEGEEGFYSRKEESTSLVKQVWFILSSCL
jgi:hypothetical protein